MKINGINNLSFKQKQNTNANNNNNGYIYYYGDTAVILTQEEGECYKKAQKQIHKNIGVATLIGAIATPIVNRCIKQDYNLWGAAIFMTMFGAVGGSVLGWLYSFIDKKCAGQYLPKQKLIWERAMARQKQANM